MTSSQCKVYGPTASPQVERQALKLVFIVANPLYHIATWRTAAPNEAYVVKQTSKLEKLEEVLSELWILNHLFIPHVTPQVCKNFLKPISE